MNCFKPLTIATLTLVAFANTQAATPKWQVNNEASQINFTSIKKGSVAEIHHFTEITGTISESGQVEISIDLASAETNIAIRNERLSSYLFETDKYPSALISTKITPDTISKLAAGETLQLTRDVTISLHNQSKKQPVSLTVNKLKNNELMVTSAQPVIINAADYGLTDGINKLRDLAGLPSISYAIPVTFTLHLNAQ